MKYINLKFNKILFNCINFRLIYFVTYTVQFPQKNTFVTWRWPTERAKTRQFKIKTNYQT